MGVTYIQSITRYNYEGANISFDYKDGVVHSVSYDIPATLMNFSEVIADINNYFTTNSIPVSLQLFDDGFIHLVADATTTSISNLVLTDSTIAGFIDLMGGVWSSEIHYDWHSSSWGASRFPFVFDLTNSSLIGGVQNKQLNTKKLSGKDYVTANGTASNKLLIRKGYIFNIRLDYAQIETFQAWLEYVRNGEVVILNGSNYNFSDTTIFNVLVNESYNYKTIYAYLDVVSTQLSILEKGGI